MNRKPLKIFALMVVILSVLSIPVIAEEFTVDQGKYQGWGVIKKVDPGFVSATYHWKIYPEYPANESCTFYPGDIIAEQRIIYSGTISYASFSAGKVHITVANMGHRTAYQFDKSELKPGEQAIIGSIEPARGVKNTVIIIKLIDVAENGKATFQISSTQF
jgi:hypothetical protein